MRDAFKTLEKYINAMTPTKSRQRDIKRERAVAKSGSKSKESVQ